MLLPLPLPPLSRRALAPLSLSSQAPAPLPLLRHRGCGSGVHARRHRGLAALAMGSHGGVSQDGYKYRYPRPAVTVDTVIVARSAPPQLLLIRRMNEPFKDCWALPGGFVDEDEPLNAAAARELQEETSVDPASVPLVQVGAFGDPGRDPRGWTVTVAYGAIVPTTDLGVKAADDARDARWFDVAALPTLAFDHKLVVKEALRTLAAKPESHGDLQQSLSAAADKLEGPWQQGA
uniref:Nudix hydrolase domain-containing protein n=1 Tax=Chlamydomonas euryale TaxID=1486919 RepID=A0A7R9VAD3_9CHLO